MHRGRVWPQARTKWSTGGGDYNAACAPVWGTVNINFTVNTGTIVEPDFELIEFTGRSRWAYIKESASVQYHWSSTVTGVDSNLFIACTPPSFSREVGMCYVVATFTNGVWTDEWDFQSNGTQDGGIFFANGHDTHFCPSTGFRVGRATAYVFTDFGVLKYTDLWSLGIDPNDTAPRFW
jgi:hypothetical protein